MRCSFTILVLAFLLSACLLWLADEAWRRWAISDRERICLIAGEELPTAMVLRTIDDDGCWAVFFELPAQEAEAFWQRVGARHAPSRFAPMFTFGIGDEELNQLEGSLVLLPSAGDGTCRYLVRLDDGKAFIAIRASYGI